MINVYAKYFIENVEYCSDSDGYWRHKRLEDFYVQIMIKSGFNTSWLVAKK